MSPGQRIITIDGPAGAGKSTLARALARRMGWSYLDTGAMYRAVALAVHEAGVDPSDEQAVERIVSGLNLDVSLDRETTRVFLSDLDVTDLIRAPQISALASAVSALPAVRRALVDHQRRIGDRGGIVAEGRDMGTVVFPEAGVKFFLTASLEERARRRFEELRLAGSEETPERVMKDMANRDRADSSRDLAPLRPADDAIAVDSTAMSIDSVLDFMLARIRSEPGRAFF
ncbi:MAG: (d)CMP kinase [Proteobacteria bacterium]|nr:(d)CMP kinase [Pseudomonadota bacterium]